MFEGLVSDLLNNILGEYIKNFSSKELDIALFSGNVTLKNLELKESALNFINLPITIVSGYIGELILSIPFSNIASEPFVIKIDKIYLVTETKLNYDDDIELKLKNEVALKLKLLKTHEENTFGKKTAHSDPTKDNNFTNKLLTKILDNIQIIITRIHIRYEDKYSNFAFGIGIEKLSITTTNEKWESEYTVGKSILYKKVSLSKFCIYLNQRDTRDINTISLNSSFENWLLAPLNANLYVVMNKERNDILFQNQPQILINCDIEKISLNLSKHQYMDVLSMVNTISNEAKFGAFRMKRPKQSVMKNPQKWWRYLFEAWKSNKGFKFSLKKLINSISDRNIYISLYKRVLNSPTESEISDKERKALLLIESNSTYEQIIYFRACAAKVVKSELNGGAVTLRKKPKGFFSGFFSRKEKTIETGISDIEMEEMFKIIDSSQGGSIDNTPLNYQKFKFNLIMNSFEFILNDKSPFLTFNIGTTSLSLLKLTTSSILNASVSDFTATSYSDSFQLIQSNSKIENLLVLNFILNPIDSDLLFKLNFSSQSLSLTYHPLSVNKIVYFFKPEISDDETFISQNYYELDQAFSQLKQLQENSWSLADHKSVEINCIVHAPFIIIPGQSPDELIVFDLGKLEFNSNVPCSLDNFNSKILSYLPNNPISARYDSFTLSLSNLECYIFQNNKKSSIIEPISIYFNILNGVSICLDGTYPQFIIQSILPLISLKISPSIIRCLRDIIIFNFLIETSDKIEITSKRAVHRKLSLVYDKSEGPPRKRIGSILDISKREVLMNKINVLLYFGLPNFKILLFDDSQIKLRDIFSLNINELELVLQNRSFDNLILFNLGGFEIKTISDFILVSTNGSISSFVNAKLQYTSSDSPRYVKVDSSLNVDFSEMSINLCPMHLHCLVEDFFTFFSPILNFKMTKKYENSDAILTENDVINTSHEGLGGLRGNKSSIQIFLGFKACKINLIVNGHIFTEFICNFSATYFQYNLGVDLKQYPNESSYLLRFNFKRLSLKYFSKDLSKCDIIQSSKLDDALECELNQFSKLEFNYPGYNLSFTSTVTNLSFVFLYRYIDEILNFSSNEKFNSILEIINASKKDTNSIKKIMPTTKITFTKLNLNLINLSVHIPLSSTNLSNTLVFVVERINLSNRLVPIFDEEDELKSNNFSELEDIFFDAISDAAPNIIMFQDETLINVSPLILSYIDLTNSFRVLKVNNVNVVFLRNPKYLSLTLNVPDFTITLSQFIYQFLIDLLNKNFIEKSTVNSKCLADINHVDTSNIQVANQSSQFLFNFNMGEFAVLLKKNDGSLEADDLFKIYVQNFKISCDFSSNSTIIHSTFSKVKFADISFSTRQKGVLIPYISVIETFSNMENENFIFPIIFNLVISNNNYEIDISLNYFRLNFSGVLFSLVTFFSIPVKLKSLDPDSSDDNLNKVIFKNRSIILLHLRFNSPTISFIQDPTNKNTQKLDLSWDTDISLKYDEALSFNCSVKNFQIFRSLIEIVNENPSQKIVTYIMQPLNLNVDFIQTKSNLLNCTKITSTIGFSELNATLTCMDFRLLLDSVKNASTPEIPPLYSHHLFQNEDLVVITKPAAKQIIQDIEVSLVISGVKVCIVNNLLSYELHVARIILPEIKLLFSAFDKNMSISSSLNLEAEYFNLNVMTFEPAIESFQFELLAHKFNNFWDFKLRSNKIININLSQACIVGLKDTIEFLTKVEDQNDSDIHFNHMHIDYKPYKIVNNSEQKITFCLSGFENNTMISLLPSQIEDLSFPANLDSTSHLIDIYFNDFVPLNYLRIDKLGIHKFTLFSLKADLNDITIICEIFLQNFIKIVSIHSERNFVNYTSIPLIVFGHTVNPGSNFWLPVNIQTDSFDFNFFANNNFNTFSYSSELIPVDFEDNYSFLLSFINNNHFKFVLQFEKNENNINYFVRPSLMIENLLPYNILVLFESKATQSNRLNEIESPLLYNSIIDSSSQCLVKSENLISIINSGSAQNEITLKIIDYYGDDANSTNSVNLKCDVNKVLKKIFVFEQKTHLGIDCNYERLSVCCEISNPYCEGYSQLVVYVPYWIYNLASIPIVFNELQDDNHFIFGNLTLNLSKFDTDQSPLLFNWEDNSNNNKLLTVKHSLGDWSEKFNIDAVGYDGKLSISGVVDINECKPLHELGLSINLAPRNFRQFTKTVKFLPRYVLVNELDLSLQYRQCDTDTYAIQTLAQNSSKIFYWADSNMDQLVRIRMINCSKNQANYLYFTEDEVNLESNWLWSGYFKLDVAGEFLLPIHSSELNVETMFIQVQIRFQGSQFFVTFSRASSTPYYLIENQSAMDSLRITQSGVNRWQFFEPFTSSQFAWEQPLLPRILIVQVINDINGEHEITLDNIDIDHCLIIDLSLSRKLFFYQERRGPTIVLIMSDLPNPTSVNSQHKYLISNKSDILLKRMDHLKKISESLLLERKLLYKKISDSQINFSNEDNFLAIEVKEARNLPHVSVFGSCNPYVICTVGNQQFKTKTMFNILNPFFSNELFVYKLNYFENHLDDLVLQIACYHSSTLTSDIFLGGIFINLSDIAFFQNKSVEDWFALLPLHSMPNILGDVKLKISWIHGNDKLIQMKQEIFGNSILYNESLITKLDSHLVNLKVESELLTKKLVYNELFLTIENYSFDENLAKKIENLVLTFDLNETHYKICFTKFNGSYVFSSEMFRETYFCYSDNLESNLKIVLRIENGIALGSLVKNLKSDIRLDSSFLNIEFNTDFGFATFDLKTSLKNNVDEINLFQFRTSLNLKSFGLSFIDKSPRELYYVSFNSIVSNYILNGNSYNFDFKLYNFQIDYHQANIYKVVLGMTPLKINDEEALLPFLQIGVDIDKTSESKLILINYFSVLMQQVDIQVEDSLIWSMLDYMNEIRFSVIDESKISLVENPRNYITFVSSVDTRIYFKLLQIQPLFLNISFQLNSSRKTLKGFNPILMMINLLGTTIGSIDRAPLRFNSVLIENSFGSTYLIIGTLINHYYLQAVVGGYRLLGSFEFLGNPSDLISHLGSAVFDFFYEPAAGIMKSPKDFGKGFAKGSLSLVTNTISGILSTSSKLTNSLSKGISMLTFDENFEAKQLLNSQRGGLGIISWRLLSHGVKSGFIGFALDPYYGAQNNGLKGFAKGVGKGIVGLFAKPTSALLRIMATILQNVNKMSRGEAEVKCVRLPRFIPKNGQLLKYSIDASIANQSLNSFLVLKEYEKSLYPRVYLNSFFKLERDRLVLISSQHLIYSKIENDYFSLIWFLNLNLVRIASAVNNTIEILYLSNDFELFNSNKNIKFIQCNSITETQSLLSLLKSTIHNPEIISAMYGAYGAFINVTSELIEHLGPYCVGIRGGNYNNLFGIDPLPGKLKVLIVNYKKNGHYNSISFRENDDIKF